MSEKKTKSPFWYWYQFLRRSEGYRECCSSGGKGEFADLYRHFGDVHSLKWGAWWASHKQLFTQEEKYLTKRMRSIAELENYYEDGDKDQAIFLVNLNAPQVNVIKDIEKKLRFANKLRNKHHKKSRGRPLLDTSFYHQYGLTPVPSKRDLMAMERMLNVLDLCRKEDKKTRKRGLTRFQIGNKLGITFATDIDRHSGGEMKQQDKKNRMTATVCRYLRLANEIVANVEQGAFPKKIENPSARKKFL